MEGSLLIDVSRLVARTGRGRLPTGIDRVCLAYLERFGPQAQAVLRWRSWRRIAPHGASQELFALLRRPGPSFRADIARIIARACLPPWPSQHGRDRIYFNHGHSGLEDPGLADWLRRTGQKPVYMVHDLIPFTHPQYCRQGERERHLARLQAMLGSAAGVLTNSEATAGALRDLAQARGWPLPPLQAAPLAPATLHQAVGPSPLAAPYFVVLGTIEPRKNHAMLLQAWRELVAQSGGDAPHLVVIGQRGWDCDEVVEVLEQCGSLRGVVHELSSCPDDLLARYLTHARALLFPSFAEGYGLPVVEALSLGTPVIASELPVFREVAGSVPDYLDPNDSRAWLQAIRDYAQPASPQRAAQLQRLQRFETPSWDRHFAQVEALLERVR